MTDQIEDKIDDQVVLAYKKLKQDVYYDTTDIFLRSRIAAFETSDNFNERLQDVACCLKDSLKKQNIINGWLNKINIRILPKNIVFDKLDDKSQLTQVENQDQISLITNLRTHHEYWVKGVNYFIDAPVELHILDTLWCMNVGKRLDEQLDDSCLGNRLNKYSDLDDKTQTTGLFKIFISQYSKWRDTAIKRAETALENNANVLLIGLDIKQCFYHLDSEWNEIEKITIPNALEAKLTDVVKKIHNKYYEIASSFLDITHPSAREIKGLPVGLSSSRVISNWRLHSFDMKVRSILQPLYFGRYVDDMLLVIQSPMLQDTSNPIAIIDQILIKEGLLEKLSDGEYALVGYKNLRIQSSKIVVQYFDYHHSFAGLKEFRREIDAQASEFRFLPSGDELRGLDDCAYDVIYKGSVNKLRSVVGLEENGTELSKYLSRRIIQHRLCHDGLSQEHIQQLFKFYKGKNVFDFCRLWEKVFTLFIINNRDSDTKIFYKECFETIDKLKHEKKNIQNKLIEDLKYYLLIALSIPCGLKLDNLKSDWFYLPEDIRGIFFKLCEDLRISNLIRHQYVSYPLINYTKFNGDLINLKVTDLSKDFLRLSEERLKWSPRYIHLDECQLFNFLEILSTNIEEKSFLTKSLCEIEQKELNDLHQLFNFDGEDQINASTPVILEPIKPEEGASICVGIANIKVNDEDIRRAYEPNKIPNISFSRQSNLFDLLNSAIAKKSCDMLVLPEVSIPVIWLPFMVNFARRHQMAIIFGLEHWVVDKNVHNFVVTLLPYTTEFGYKSCLVSLRLKNHYAPNEVFEINRLGMKVVSPQKAYYEKFFWKGINFTVYNCFELADIKHRGLMRSELDLLIAISWNKDIPYYANIVESVTRDLHCYTIHVNTSQYGDSRIVLPKKSEEMNIVRIKGGINTVVIKEELGIFELRDFQIRTYSPDEKRFKPTPAGYDHDQAQIRAQQLGDNIVSVKRIVVEK